MNDALRFKTGAFWLNRKEPITTLGTIAILADMWPVVAKEHLAELKRAIVCVAN